LPLLMSYYTPYYTKKIKVTTDYEKEDSFSDDEPENTENIGILLVLTNDGFFFLLICPCSGNPSTKRDGHFYMTFSL